MKKPVFFLLISFIFLANTLSAQNRTIYQIKTYLMNSEQQMEVTENFLKDAYLPASKRTGINHIVYFNYKTINGDYIKNVVVLITFASLHAFLNIDDKISTDNNYKTAGANYLDASFYKPPNLRIESTLLEAFTGHPNLTV